MRRADRISPLQLIRDTVPTLGGATLRVATLILEAPERAGNESITRLAERAQTSAATVTRLATLLGFEGYPALRAAIATQHGRDIQAGWEGDIGTEITPSDSPETVLEVLAANQARALQNALGSIDLEAAVRVADQIAAAGRILVYGEWGDAIPARELTIRLQRIGLPVWFHDGPQSARMAIGLLGEGDVALVVSRSGNDASAQEFLERAGERGAMTVAIIGVPDSPVADRAEVGLFTGTREGTTWTDYFAGRASDTLTAGLLWVLVAQRVSDTVASIFEARQE